MSIFYNPTQCEQLYTIVLCTCGFTLCVSNTVLQTVYTLCATLCSIHYVQYTLHRYNINNIIVTFRLVVKTLTG